MISLWKTVTDLDRLNDLQRVAIDCYALAVATSGQFAVEVDPTQAAEFREHLLALEKQLRAAATPDELQTVATSYRGEVREYHDKARKQLDHLRQEVTAAADAMKAFADSVASTGADHQEQVEEELKTLQTLSKSEDINQIRGGIRATANTISSSVEKMRRSNQLVIAQLQDEIRLLHQEIQTKRQPPKTEQKLDSGIAELIGKDAMFCLLLVGIRNYKDLARQHSPTAIAGALKAVLARFQQLVGDQAPTGPWTEGQFFAILRLDAPSVMGLSREVTNKLSREYTVQENGSPHTVTLQLTAGIVDRRAGTDVARFRKQLDQISDALARA